MQAKAIRFMRIPFFASGIEVTDDNMDEIAEWCEGSVVRETTPNFVRVPVLRVTHKRWTEGHVGMWVIRTILQGEPSFKVYDPKWLFKQFMPMDQECLDGLDVVTAEEADDILASVENEQQHCCCKNHKPQDPLTVPVQNKMPTPASIRRAS